MPETKEDDEQVPDMSLLDIIDGKNERDIPIAKFIDDIGKFAESFQPPASTELLIGAYTQLYNKYKSYEASLTRKQQHLDIKIPDLENSLKLIQQLLKKKEEGESGVVRYSLADNIYAKADLDYDGTVNLWLGANVMLEYTYEEAIEFLANNESRAKSEAGEVEKDLAFVRDQIVVCEVLQSRIYNWDVRRRRALEQKA
ncbi:hypothetical protein FisN_12Lh202 [Fistulifera solaris]|uniref:Prefoldin subunit 3 n=1 Tax=Fistulifera solaris TaxID=1519565 RepID=A0A1Z5JML4_FISSO|nr:hypothetical protein FisN_12Lh202 [Fistulifera solaris]|eukprot:GAX15102.1 hypothetical protein FisN_12Lh202 [Fistulifera solaris]